MDKATVARRVRALRALSVDPGATDSERASAKRFADRLEAKWGKTEPPSVSSPEWQAYLWERERYGPTHHGKTHYTEHPWSTPDMRIFVGDVKGDDYDSLIEDGWLYDEDDSY